MEDLWLKLESLLSLPGLKSALAALAIFLVTALLAKVARAALVRALRNRLSVQATLLAGRGVFYLVLGLGTVSALNELGVDLGILMGAAGVLTVALGFASQTSVSNVISGLFLVGERPFEIGEVIRVGSTTGEVLSVDLLSVRLRTFDNLLVRIPNEMLLKSEIVNVTRFPIRRFDLQVGVAYASDLGRVEGILRGVAQANPLSLREPQPLFQILAFGESSIDLQFSIWATQESYLEAKTSFQGEVKEAFDAAGIEIPFPQRVVHGRAARWS